MKQPFKVPDYLVVKPSEIKKQQEIEDADLEKIEDSEEETQENQEQEPDFERFD